MNSITVTACGAPGSFVRSVQENPQDAVDLLDMLETLCRCNAQDIEHGLNIYAKGSPRDRVWKAAEKLVAKARAKPL